MLSALKPGVLRAFLGNDPAREGLSPDSARMQHTLTYMNTISQQDQKMFASNPAFHSSCPPTCLEQFTRKCRPHGYANNVRLSDASGDNIEKPTRYRGCNADKRSNRHGLAFFCALRVARHCQTA